MNKLLAITSGLLVAGAANAEFTMPAFSVNSKVGFETAHVSEGRRSMEQNFAPSIEVGLPLFGAGDLYIGIDAYLLANPRKQPRVKTLRPGLDEDYDGNEGLRIRNEIDPYIGFSYDVTDMFTLDLGYTYKRYSSKGRLDSISGKRFAVLNKAGNKFVKDDKSETADITEGSFKSAFASLPTKRYSHEIYAGVMADVLLNPSLYFSYDFTQRKANIEGALGYTFDLGSFGAHGLAIDLGAKLGYSRVTKPYGIKQGTKVIFETVYEKAEGDHKVGAYKGMAEKPSNLFEKKGWFYGTLSADLVYSLNDNTKARAGVAFAFNNAKKDSWINSLNRKKHNVWFSSAIEFAF